MSKALKGNETFFIEASGMVQGLGFRPYVYNLAKKHNLSGSVRNTGRGAEIHAQGKDSQIKAFIYELKNSDFEAFYKIKKINAKKYVTFRIIKSKKNFITSEFPPDLAMCDDCKKELFDKNDRRYLYPFINCVKCGPRFSIIKTLPYDRKNTTMHKFKMCGECSGEYNNPGDRRFHAQPNACPKCGPKIELYDAQRKLLSSENKALQDVTELLNKGHIIALKSISGYHLVCDALNNTAVKKLRKRKNRPYKPFAVMADIKTAEKLCRISRYESKTLQLPSAPVVLLKKRKDSKVPGIIAPGSSSLGLMLPYAPLHHILIRIFPMLIMTSGNRSDEPISINEEEAFINLKGLADYFLINDRDIENRSDDSVIKHLDNEAEKIIIRRSRGYVPVPVKIPLKENVLGAGSDIKNNFCITRNENAYLSQFTGDLQEKKNMIFYAESIKKMQRFLDVKPQKAFYDAHEGYFSSQYVNKKYKKSFPLYHHYMHLASVMAEYGINGKCIGFIFDGSGYGEDGTVWGGEVLAYKGKKFLRLANFDTFYLPGGDLCINEVWRTAISVLFKYGLLHRIPENLKKKNYKTIIKMLEQKINSPLTSSAGRLFDAVSALSGIKEKVTFEAEAPLSLESLTDASIKKKYSLKIKENTIIFKDLLLEILNDLESGVSSAEISTKFHNALCSVINECAKKYSVEYKTKKILLGGGVFQNTFLLKNTIRLLKKSGFEVYFNKQVPVNDGGLCIGQAYSDKLMLKNK